MKLIHLLATKLEEWPEGVKYITQDADSDVWFVVTGWVEGNPQYISDNKTWEALTDQCHYRILDEVGHEILTNDHTTACITEDMFNKYKQMMTQLEETSRFKSTPIPYEVDTSPWKIYPTQIEVVDDEGDVVLQLETADSATCTIKINHYLIGNNDVDKLCEMIRKGVTMLELE